MGATTRGAFPYPNAGDNWKQIRTAIQSLAQKIADVGVVFAESTFATRPAVGVPGRFHRSTDFGGLLSLDTGTAWVWVPNSSAPAGFATAAHGAIGGRPAASAATADSFYLITDASGGGVIGTLYYCDGTTWTPFTSKAVSDATYVVRGDVQYASVTTSESTTSTTYTDLATVGPAVTATIGASNKALVMLGSNASNSLAANFDAMSVAVSGASTIPAGDSNIVAATSALANSPIGDYLGGFILTGLTPGSNTFTAKYRVGGGTGTFARRRIIVIPL